MDTLLIKNGIIVNSDKEYKSDIYIENGVIKKISPKISLQKKIPSIDAAGMFVMPGGIDAHVHLKLPTPAGNSCDDFKSGSIAAIAGGTTSFIDFVTPKPNQSLIEALSVRKKEAVDSLLDYSFHMSITGWTNHTEQEILQCIKKEGINSFKIYLAYKGVIGIDDNIVVKLMDIVGNNKGIITAHCENGDLIKMLQDKFLSENKKNPVYHALSRPVEAEAEAVSRMIYLSKTLNCPLYIVHVSSAEAINIIKKAKLNQQKIFAETCPHYLLLDDSKYSLQTRKAISYILSPPLRKRKDQQALWRSLTNNLIDVIATDHCPFNNKGQKDIGLNNFTKVPNGGNGIEERLSLLWHFGVSTGKISRSDFVKYNCTNPAQIFGLYPKKGTLQVNSDADIVIWNPDKIKNISAKTHHQNCDTNIYEGFSVKGAPEKVIVQGKIMWENDKLTGSRKGKFLARKMQ